MSDIPESYFVNGVELLNFRREPYLYYPGELQRKGYNRKKYDARRLSNKLLIRDGNLCHYCSVQMKRPGDKGYEAHCLITVEHVVPRSMGGRQDLRNLVLACIKCNNKFGNELNKCYCDFCKNARALKGL